MILHSAAPLYTLSSAVVGGGFAQVHTIINRHVEKNYHSDDPAADLLAFASGRHIQGAFLGLLTAVWMRQARSVTHYAHNITVSAIITAGVGNASAAGLSPPQEVRVGTINIILLIDASLAPGAMVNAVNTATEAKTASLFARRVQTAEGYAASGTSTDAVVIACTGRGPQQAYAGPVTPVGHLVGSCVRACLEAALDAP